MTPISRDFAGRRCDVVDLSRIPPGQYFERGFPVLSAGPTPRTPLEEWTFSSQGAVDGPRRPHAIPDRAQRLCSTCPGGPATAPATTSTCA